MRAKFSLPYPLQVWGLLGLTLIVVWYFDHQTNVWMYWFSRLLLGYGLALFITRQLLDSLGLVGKVVAAIVCALLAALLVEHVLNLFMVTRSNSSSPLGGRYDWLLATTFSAYLLISSILEEESRKRVESERQLVALKLNALQAQIEPHFLYNTLANVQQLVRSTPHLADTMLQHLITYLKAVIPDIRNGRGLLGQELDRVQSYLQIMQIRMGPRLQFEINVDDALRDVAVPPLGLLTLVENAVQHGIDRLPEGGKVTVDGANVGKMLTLRVVDNGVGFGDEIGSGTGLANLRERLATLYGDDAKLELSHASPRGVEAKLQLPLDRLTSKVDA